MLQAIQEGPHTAMEVAARAGISAGLARIRLSQVGAVKDSAGIWSIGPGLVLWHY